ncbi:hypothetical protein GCM10028771_12030 [Nocardioides marmoraquaticus]
MGVSAPTTRRPRRRVVLEALALLLVWAAVAVPVTLYAFTHDGRESVVAGHDAVVTPTLDGWVQLRTGPYLPDLRLPAEGRVGVDVVMGKTTADTATEVAERYAAIAAHPDAEQRRVTEVVRGQVGDALVRGTLAGLVLPGLWLLLGVGRRRQLAGVATRTPRTWRGWAAYVVVLGLVIVLLPKPWEERPTPVQDDTWLSLGDAYPDLQVPTELAGWQVQGGMFTTGTRRLLQSALDTYDRSTRFYDDVLERVDDVADDFRTPDDGDTVAVLVTDRHDNIGMDAVVRRAADAAGATAVITGGDDTSTGEPWEAFSLDSLDAAFEGYEHRFSISGNHDHGDFVAGYLAERGWTHLDGEPVDLDGVRVTGIDDPRSSGLGTWRDESGLSFTEVEQAIADDVCARDADGDRTNLLVVHDANLGREALAQGCADLVVAGHLHAQVGPDAVEGANGEIGYTYTNGTTGGAAYAIAIGSKLRRDAQFTLLTFRDGRPVGLQPVDVDTRGRITVQDYVELDLDDPTEEQLEQPSSTPSPPAPEDAAGDAFPDEP